MSPTRIPPENIIRYFRDHAGAILDVLDLLVRTETPSGDSHAIERFVRTYGGLLDDAGIEWHELRGRVGPMIRAHLPGAAGASQSPLILVGHSDTVWPLGEVARRPPRERDGLYYGPGAFDMKAGLALAVFVLRFLRLSGAPLSRSLDLYVSPDEELGSATAHAHMELLVPRDAIALILEPPLPDGSLKLWRKGVGMYRLAVRGREAHAGSEPDAGRSAIVEMARRILEIHGWNDPGRGLRVNVGEVRGGIATNVIAGSAEAGIDTRFDSLADGKEIDRRLRSLSTTEPEISLVLSGGIIFPPLAPDDRSRALADRAVEIGGQLGMEISQGRSGGGSDGSFLASLGVSVLDGLGVDGGGAHAQDEHIRIDRLPLRAALLARLILAIDGGAG